MSPVLIYSRLTLEPIVTRMASEVFNDLVLFYTPVGDRCFGDDLVPIDQRRSSHLPRFESRELVGSSSGREGPAAQGRDRTNGELEASAVGCSPTGCRQQHVRSEHSGHRDGRKKEKWSLNQRLPGGRILFPGNCVS